MYMAVLQVIEVPDDSDPDEVCQRVKLQVPDDGTVKIVDQFVEADEDCFSAMGVGVHTILAADGYR